MDAAQGVQDMQEVFVAIVYWRYSQGVLDMGLFKTRAGAVLWIHRVLLHTVFSHKYQDTPEDLRTLDARKGAFEAEREELQKDPTEEHLQKIVKRHQSPASWEFEITLEPIQP